MKQLYIKLFLAFLAFLIGINYAQSQFTETFESLSNNQNSFTSDGQPFDTTNGNGFRTQTSFPGTGASGSHVYLDNDSNAGTGTTHSIQSSDGGIFTMSDLDLFLSTDTGASVGGSGGIIIRGILAGTTEFTITITSGIPTAFSPDNGFFNVDFSTEGGSDNSTTDINELEFELTGSFNYIAVDEFNFTKALVDINPPLVQSIVVSGNPTTLATSVDFIVTFNENANNVTTDDFSVDAVGTSGNITAISGSGTTYTITVSSISGEGTIGINLDAGTDIEDALGNSGPPTYTAGIDHVVSACFLEDFETFSETATTFTSNGLPFAVTNGLTVFNLNNAGASNSDQYLENNGSGSGAYSIGTTGGELFTMKTMDLYLSSVVNGFPPTNDGTLTINGKVAGGTVYTITKTTGFPTSTGNGDNGFFNLNFATDGAANYTTVNVDEIEINIGSAFVYLAVDDFEICEEGTVDTFPPEVQSIALVGSPTTLATSVDFTVTFNENVINVTTDDFSLDTSGTTGNIASVTGSANVYTVTVNNITGSGTISIDLDTGTNIEDAVGNSNPPAFTSGENHIVSDCFIENFDSFSTSASVFTSNGQSFTSTNGLVVENINSAGTNNSDQFLENNGAGVGSYSITTTDNALFNADTMYLYLSSNGTGITPTDDGTATIRGKVAGVTVFTIDINSSSVTFPTSPAQGNNGFFLVDFATTGASDFSGANIDEIEIEIISSFVYLSVDSFEFCLNVAILPAVQSIVLQGSPAANATAVTYVVTFDENVNSISTDDFDLTATGTASASIASVSASSGTTVNVTVNTIVGDGTLRLDLLELTNITNNAGNGDGTNGHVASFTSGEVHTLDLVAPTGYSVAIDQSPINNTNEDSVSFTFSSAEVGATYNYSFTSSGGIGSVTGSGTVGSSGSVISGIDLSGLSDGTITLNVTLTDTNGNIGIGETDTETKETVAPTGYSVGIDQSPINNTNEETVSFTLSSAEVGATYNYSFTSSGGIGSVTGTGTVISSGSVISGIDLSGLSDGTISLNVTLTDTNGNIGIGAIDTETKETVAPTGYSVAIDQSPINNVNEGSVSFTFSSAEVGATYNYSFTSSGGIGSVTGTGTVISSGSIISGIDLSGLSDGTITLNVTLTDTNGNTGIGETDTETKETVAPTGYSVAIDQSPINNVNEGSTSFTFTSAEVGATYNYSFTSSGGIGSVTGTGTVISSGSIISGIDLSGLSDGTITLNVTLTDINGNTGIGATDTETKETVAPTGYSVVIDQSPINNTNEETVSFTFTSAEVGSTYNYSFTSSGGIGSVTGSGTVGSSGSVISGIDLSGLSDGTVTLNVTLTDTNGNIGIGAIDTETKETVAPTGYSVVINQSPINNTNEGSVSFTFSSAEVGSTYNYSFTSSGGIGSVTGTGTVISSGSIISGIDLSGLSDGTITLNVTLTDTNGNIGIGAIDTETKETVAPTGYSVAIDQSPINNVNEGSTSFTFTSAEVGATYNYSFTSSGGIGSVTGTGTVGSSGSIISGIDLSGLSDGTITLNVTLTDTNGNTGIGETDTETKETVAPTGYSVVIDQSPINNTNEETVSFTLSSAEVGATYNYSFTSSGGIGSVTGSGTVGSSGSVISGIDLSGLSDGTVTLNVTLTDTNGNIGIGAIDTETKETVAPTGYSVVIDQSPINNTNEEAVSFTFTSAEVGSTYNYSFTSSGGIGSVTGTGTVITSGSIISGIDLSGLFDGTITLNVTLTDTNGNTGIGAIDTETKESTAPIGYSVAIDQSPINNTNEDSVSFTFSSAEVATTYNYSFTSSGGIGSVTGTGTVGSSGSVISGIDLSGLSDGTITLNVTLTDAGGNTGIVATDTETKETVSPTGYSVVIDQSPINNTNEETVSFTFTSAEVGATYNYSFTSSGGIGSVTGTGTVLSSGSVTSGIDLSGLSDGTISLNVTLTDTNGNTGIGAIDTETKETIAPTGYSVVIDQSPINNVNEETVSFTFSSAEIGTTYNYSFTSNGGIGSVTGTGTVGSSDLVISGIDLSDLSDGTISLNATLTTINGNIGIGATDTETKETTAPTVIISSTESSPTTSNLIPIIITFNESVSSFEIDDITVTNGIKSNFSGSGTTYRFDVTPTVNGDVDIDVNAGVSIDTFGNLNIEANQFTINYDTTLDADYKLILYPNPTSGELNITTNPDLEILSVEIFDMRGKFLYLKSLERNININTLDMSNFQSGVYFLKISTEDKTTIKRVIRK